MTGFMTVSDEVSEIGSRIGSRMSSKDPILDPTQTGPQMALRSHILDPGNPMVQNRHYLGFY